MVFCAMKAQLNSSRAFLCAREPIHLAWSKFSQILQMPQAMLPGFGSTKYPSLSGRTKSRGPPHVVATTGFPAAQASRTTMPKGSFRLGTTTASQDLNSDFKCAVPLFTDPAKATAWPMPRFCASASKEAFMCPSPTKTNLASPRACKTIGIASNSKSGPFCTANRPTKRNMGAMTSKPLSRFVLPVQSSCHSMSTIGWAWMPL
mmetsp:Transcript_111420/g.278987  ORF Transcript_111420/g.278987 Transcript_111420/m.278987 type:complete len:204 (-) Transcript_111420:328-939(-)